MFYKKMSKLLLIAQSKIPIDYLRFAALIHCNYVDLSEAIERNPLYFAVVEITFINLYLSHQFAQDVSQFWTNFHRYP